MTALPVPVAAVEAVAYGTPAPQGSKRHVGHGVLVESSAAVRPWREAVKAATLAVRSPEPLAGPLSVELVFTLPRPKSRPRRDHYPDRRPDLDKLIRSTLDALGEAGAWCDDAQVVHLVASKVYASEPGALPVPGCRVTVTPTERY